MSIELRDDLRLILVGLALFVGLTATAAGQGDAHSDVFTEFQGKATTAKQADVLGRLESLATTAEIHLLRLQGLAPLQQTGTWYLPLTQRRAVVHGTRIESRGIGDWTLYGDVLEPWDDEARGQITLVVQKGQVTASVRTPDDLFRIVPLGGDLHALVRVDKWAFVGLGRDHPAEAPRLALKVGETMAAPVEKAGTTTIGVLVAYTAAAAAEAGNINSLIQLAIDETNTAYSRSNVSLRLQLRRRLQVSYTESGNHLTDLNRFRDPYDGHMDNVHAQRDQYAGDVAVLVTTSQGCEAGTAGECFGFASAIMATESSAFATVRPDAMTGRFTFGHEIGHLLSARHDNDPNAWPYTWGHGYYNVQEDWQTIMAVDRAPFVDYIQNFSNPNVSHGGDPTGTSSWRDNARVLNDYGPVVAGFRIKTYIAGPNPHPAGTSGTWTAVPENVGGPKSYRWYTSTNGSSWTYTGVTSKSYTTTPYANFYLKVDIVSSNPYLTYGYGEATLHVYATTCSECEE